MRTSEIAGGMQVMDFGDMLSFAGESGRIVAAFTVRSGQLRWLIEPVVRFQVRLVVNYIGLRNVRSVFPSVLITRYYDIPGNPQTGKYANNWKPEICKPKTWRFRKITNHGG